MNLWARADKGFARFVSMKKCLLILSTLICINLYSQETHRVYCELLGVGKLLSEKVTVKVDFGQEVNYWTEYYNQFLVDENGKKITFNSMVDAMNYMGKFGWKFEQAYVITTAYQNVYHWLLSKDITDDDEIDEGFTTKQKFKDQKNNIGNSDYNESSPGNDVSDNNDAESQPIKIVSYSISSPNSANGVDATFRYINLSDKTIKYLVWEGYAINAVGDPVICSVRNSQYFYGKDTGPIKPNRRGGGIWDCALYNSTARKLVITKIDITYMDGSQITISGDALYKIGIRKPKDYSSERSKKRDTKIADEIYM